jgi:predicted transposase/invertase (TIGR01784 family)
MAKKQSIKQEKPEKMRLTVDYAFKRVFGRNGNEGILKDFLESILDIEIKNITIQNPEIPKNMRDSKIGILDVRAEINGKEIIEVEMQVQNQYNMDKRSSTYITKIYSDQLKEGDSYVEVKKVAVINILNFNYYERNSYHSVGRMKFENSKENEKVDMGYILEEQYVTDDLEMHFIELPKFRKKNPDISSKLDQWLWLICGEEEKIKMAKNENEKIKEAKSELEKLEMSAEDRELYELRLKAIRDEINIRESGYTDGMKDGEEKGKKQKSIEIAKNMLKKQIPLELIEELTGISQSEIEKIKD